MKIKVACLLTLALTTGYSQVGLAQADQQALARAQQMLRQINSEKSALEQQLASLQKEFDAHKKDADQQLKRAKDRESRISGSLENWQEGYEKLKLEHQQKLEELGYEKQRASLLENNLIAQSENFEICRNNNRQLAGISNELLDLYENKGFLELVKSNEAFTGLKQVEIENLIQDQRYKILDSDLEATPYVVKPVNLPEDDPRMKPKQEQHGRIDDSVSPASPMPGEAGME